MVSKAKIQFVDTQKNQQKGFILTNEDFLEWSISASLEYWIISKRDKMAKITASGSCT